MSMHPPLNYDSAPESKLKWVKPEEMKGSKLHKFRYDHARSIKLFGFPLAT